VDFHFDSTGSPTGLGRRATRVGGHREGRLAMGTPSTKAIELDLLVVGGGVAGLWALDAAHRAGLRTWLLEGRALGTGQTVAAQGILHGGLKYTLRGLLTRSAQAIRDMPERWRESLEGRRAPDLSRVVLRSACTYLWHTGDLRGRLGFSAARAGLRVRPVPLDDAQKPEVLRRWSVDRLDEQVIQPASLLGVLAELHADRLIRCDPKETRWGTRGPGVVEEVGLRSESGDELVIRPGRVLFAAGGGNDSLRARVGLSGVVSQRRPLHVPMVRGRLPELNAHCIDGGETRLTITTDHDHEGETVWHVGGRVSERGVGLGSEALIELARAELAEALPDLDLSGAQWGTFRVDRCERVTAGGARPDGAELMAEGNTLSAWPTKLVLAPVLAERVVEALGGARGAGAGDSPRVPVSWPRPGVALPPWEGVSWRRMGAGLGAGA
jgi:glycerol-3-phosphate dehydrogenase